MVHLVHALETVLRDKNKPSCEGMYGSAVLKAAVCMFNLNGLQVLLHATVPAVTSALAKNKSRRRISQEGEAESNDLQPPPAKIPFLEEVFLLLALKCSGHLHQSWGKRFTMIYTS